MTVPDPTSCSFLLPSVNISIVCSFALFCLLIVTYLPGESNPSVHFMIQLMVFLVPCNTVYICCFFGLYFYRCYSGQGAKSFIGGRSIRLCYFDIDEPLHSAVYSFVTFLFRCPYLNWCAVQHGGRMAPLYILLSASCFSPQFSFADLTSACISVVHFLDVCIMCSLKFYILYVCGDVGIGLHTVCVW